MFIRCVTSQWFGVTSWVCSLRGLNFQLYNNFQQRQFSTLTLVGIRRHQTPQEGHSSVAYHCQHQAGKGRKVISDCWETFGVIRTGARKEGGGINLAGKVNYLFLVTIDVYRLENRKIEVCRVSGGGGTHGGLGTPGASIFINSS